MAYSVLHYVIYLFFTGPLLIQQFIRVLMIHENYTREFRELKQEIWESCYIYCS